VSKQTLCGWVRQISDVLGPVERAQWASVVSSDVLMADETTVKLQRPEHCHTAWLWGYLGDRDEVVFEFSTSREARVPVAALKGFRRGTLVCDGYSGYNELVRDRKDVHRGGCWAHARREFFEAKGNDEKRALRVLALIAQLYDVEREAAGLAEGWCRSRAERDAVVLAVRRMKSVPVLRVLEAALFRMRDQVLPKSPIGKAIAYTLGQWKDLERFTSDGAIPIDNNALEREMRTIAVGRRNWTFCGSEDGGAWAARLYGLLGTCRLQGVNPYEWLQDVLTRVRRHPPERMAELTPRQWAATRRARAADAPTLPADTS
jgi:transposase